MSSTTTPAARTGASASTRRYRGPWRRRTMLPFVDDIDRVDVLGGLIHEYERAA
jgi:hypothetical protein